MSSTPAPDAPERTARARADLDPGSDLADRIANFPGLSFPLRLDGGHAEKPAIVAAFRNKDEDRGEHVDVEVQSAQGTRFSAHRAILSAESGYFSAAYGRAWASDASPRPKRRATELERLPMPADTLEACLEWIYTGTCELLGEEALYTVLDAAVRIAMHSTGVFGLDWQ